MRSTSPATDWTTSSLQALSARRSSPPSLVITGRQGREQQRLLIEAQQRDVVERRADFELNLLLDLSRLTREAYKWESLQKRPGQDDAQAIVLALPPELLPTLRAKLAPISDTVAPEYLKERFGGRDVPFHTLVQRAIDRELRDAIFERRDVGQSGEQSVSNRRSRWRRLLRR